MWLARRPAPPSKQIGLILGPMLLLAGMLCLVAALYAVIQLRGLTKGSLTLWAMGVVTVAGLVFIHCQVMGSKLVFGATLGRETSAEGKTSESDREKP